MCEDRVRDGPASGEKGSACSRGHVAVECRLLQVLAVQICQLQSESVVQICQRESPDKPGLTRF